MKLIDLLLEDSPAATQAKERGLVHIRYGIWGDPQTGEPVAKTVNGQLVKIEPKDATQAAEPKKPEAPQPTRTPDTGATLPDEDDGDIDSMTPQADSGLGRLLGAAGGDTNKLRKILAKRYHNAGQNIEQKAKAVLWIKKLDDYEKAMDAKADQAIQAAASKQQADLAAKKAKYPNPNKDL